MNPHAPSPSPRHQRGAALLMAMIIVTLVATLAVSMVWQQWRAVQVEVAERARSQSAWVLAGALDWSRIILKEDARTGGPDHLGEPWAVPLAEARLSTFLAADKENTEGGPEAFLSGVITDAQARYNLMNLFENGAILPVELKALQRLCDHVGVAPDTAVQIATQLRNALTEREGPLTPAPGASSVPVVEAPADGPIKPERVEQLAWLGISPEALRRLNPYITLLPTRTPVNLNTAPREVLSAAVAGLDLGGAERLIQARQRTPFKTLDAAQTQLSGLTLNPQQVGISSNFFIVRGRLRVGDHALEQRSLVERRGTTGRDIVALTREWVTTRDEAR